MPSFSNVQALGHLVAQPEINEAGSSKVSNFSIAVDKDYSKNDKTSFIDVAAWNRGNYKLAEYTEDYNKGDLILITGELEQQRWESNEGKSKSKVLIQADQIYNFNSLLNGKNNQSEDVDKSKTEEDIPF